MLSIIVRKVREQKSGKIGHTEAPCVSQRLQGCRGHRYFHQECYPGALDSVSTHVPVANIANTKYNSGMNMPYIAVQCQLDRNADSPKNIMMADTEKLILGVKRVLTSIKPVFIVGR